MGQHALLSPSSSKRWLLCTPSAKLGEDCERESSIYAKEGTDAHSLGELKLKHEFPPHSLRQDCEPLIKRFR